MKLSSLVRRHRQTGPGAPGELETTPRTPTPRLVVSSLIEPENDLRLWKKALRQLELQQEAVQQGPQDVVISTTYALPRPYEGQWRNNGSQQMSLSDANALQSSLSIVTDRPHGRHAIGEAAPPHSPEAAAAPSLADSFSADLKANLSSYPSAHHVVLANGHGQAPRTVAGMEYSSFTEALSRATEVAGRDVDLLLLDSCSQATLGALSSIPRSVKIVVASRNWVWFNDNPQQERYGISMHKVLPALSECAGEAADLAHLVVRQTQEDAREGGPKSYFYENTFSAFDLAALHEKLLPALDKLGAELQGELTAGHGRDVTRCVLQAGATTFVGLESFLQKLQEPSPHTWQHEGGVFLSPGTTQAAQAAERALRETIIAQTPTILGDGTTKLADPVTLELGVANMTGHPEAPQWQAFDEAFVAWHKENPNVRSDVDYELYPEG
jgi:hypothetical protein